MGDYDRRVLISSWGRSFDTVEINIHGGTTIEQGDLMFIDRVDGLRSRGTSSGDYYGYPFSDLSGATLSLSSNKTLAAKHFIGVAASHSDGGVTETIAVHTKGLFNFPLKNSRTVRVGQYVTPSGSGVTLYNQKATVETESDDYIGIAGEGGTFMRSLNVVILSRVISGVSREI